MKTRLRPVLVIIISALVVVMSTGTTFAQKTKIVKYIPQTTKSKIVPAAVNPTLAPLVRAQFAVSQPRHYIPAKQIDARKALRASKLATPQAITSVVERTVTAQVAAQQAVPTVAVEVDEAGFIPSLKPIDAYYATWRDELGTKFSEPQLDAVEKALAKADDWIFVQEEDETLNVRNPGEWDYEDRFLMLLTRGSGVSFTDRQIKQLIGGPGVKGFTLAKFFTLREMLAFSLDTGRRPRKGIREGGPQLKVSELRERGRQGDAHAAEQAQELELGQKISDARYWINDPVFSDLKALTTYEPFLNQAIAKTPQEWLEALEAFLAKNHRWPSKHREGERQLYYGCKGVMRQHSTDLASVRIKELSSQYGRLIAVRKAPQEWLEELEAFIKEHNRYPSQTNEAERPLYAGCQNAVRYNSTDSASVRIKELKQQYK